MPRLVARAAELLLGTDPHRRVRVAVAGLGLLLMVLSAVALHLVVRGGIASASAVRWWTLFSVGGLAAMVAAIRSGASRRLPDPSLTRLQMVWAITSGAWAYVIAEEARGVVPPVLSLILLFGTFNLRPRQLLGLGALAVAAFCSAVAVDAVLHRHADRNPWIEAAEVLMVVIVLGGSLALSVRMLRLRERLQLQKGELARALARIRELALHDDLTGLATRRHLLDRLAVEVARHARSGQPLVLAQLDIDHFKRINDTHGHAAGDRALRAFADAARGCLRESDAMARWGGEEFVLLLTETPPEGAQALLERVGACVAGLRVPVDGGPPFGFTVSAGHALWQPGEPVEATLARADRALYAAKAAGRNRVVAADAG